jgi:hypothetical protein
LSHCVNVGEHFTNASSPRSSSRWLWDDLEVANRPAMGVRTRRPDEPCVNNTSTVL